MSNLVTGSIFTAELPIFTGSFRNAKFSHTVTLKAEVTRESYGADRGQHTFTFRIIESSHPADFAVGKEYRKKGRNLYSNLIGEVEQPADYDARAEEKSLRASRESSASIRNGRTELINDLIADGYSVSDAYAYVNGRA